MSTFYETAGAVLAALCLGILLCWLLGRLLLPVPAPGVKVVVTGRNGGETLEQTLRALYWLRSMGLLRGTVIIDTAELTAEGRALAAELVRKYPGAELRTIYR